MKMTIELEHIYNPGTLFVIVADKTHCRIQKYEDDNWDSKEDKFCKKRLVKLDMERNHFHKVNGISHKRFIIL
jgi:hypothetical protein